ncbi:MAG: hypothetical protein JST93_23945 [Acidobacteria bacterium]|nr:hypothetical protein [Acidobacteriota bacterium]
MQIGKIHLSRGLLLLSLCSPLLAGTTVLSDVDFANADWSQVIFDQTGGGTGSFAQAATGGNPDGFRRFNMNFPNTPTGGTVIVNLVSFSSTMTYTPSLSGAITQLDFGYDIRSVGGLVAGLYRPMLRQGGNIYFLLVDDALNTAWVHHSSTATSADDWSQVNAGLGKPDFSTLGGTIEFGYRVRVFLTCNAPAGCLSGSLASGLDNYQVTITTADTSGNVPEPASSALMGAAFIAATLWRTRGLASHSSR